MDTDYSRVRINFSYVSVNKETFVKLFRMKVLCQTAACIICINYMEMYEVVTEKKKVTFSIGESDAFYGKKWHINLVRL